MEEVTWKERVRMAAGLLRESFQLVRAVSNSPFGKAPSREDLRRAEAARLEVERVDVEYAGMFLARLRETHPEWESCREVRRKDPPGMVRLVFPCPNAAMPDPLVLEVCGEVTVFWPKVNHVHFDLGTVEDVDGAFALLERVFAEEMGVGIHRTPKNGRWTGSIFCSTADRLTAAWNPGGTWEFWSWRGTYDERRRALP